MDKNDRDLAEKLAEATMWLVFIFIAVIALAVAFRIGIWIVSP